MSEVNDFDENGVPRKLTREEIAFVSKNPKLLAQALRIGIAEMNAREKAVGLNPIEAAVRDFSEQQLKKVESEMTPVKGGSA